MKTELLEDEEILHDGGVNLQRGIEAVGGWLYLTTDRLVFEAHRFNVRDGATVVPQAHVENVYPCWARFLGLIPLFPNSFAVETRKGKTYRYVTFARTEWRDAIMEAIADLPE